MSVKTKSRALVQELEILLWPSEALRRKSAPVVEITDELRDLARNMILTMKNAPGLGLAAPQVGLNIRLVVVNPAANDDEDENSFEEPFAMINPVILDSSGEDLDEEGCLSLPGVYVDIPRPERLTAEYTSIEGKRKTITAHGVFARCIAHEIDHLDGIVFWDHLTKLKRDWLKLRFKRNLKKA